MKRYTLYCDSELIESSDNLSYLIDIFSELDVDCQEDMIIIDNQFDEIVYV